MAAGVPNAGGAVVAGALNEKFPNPASELQRNQNIDTQHNPKNSVNLEGEFSISALTFCWCACSDCTRITEIKTHCSVFSKPIRMVN